MLPEQGRWVRVALVGLVLGSHSAARAETEGLVSSPIVKDPSVTTQLQEIFSSGEYRFCTDHDYRLFQHELDTICPAVSKMHDSCFEALAAACLRPAWETEIQPDAPSMASGAKTGIGESFLSALYFGSLGVGIAIFAWLFLRQARLWTREQTPNTKKQRPEAPRVDEDLFEQESKSGPALLGQAEKALLEGNQEAALALLYQANISTLAQTHWLTPHRSKTAGDYQRSLSKVLSATQDASQVATIREASALLGAIDRARFGRSIHLEGESQIARELLRKTGELVQNCGKLLALLLCVFPTGCDSVQPEPPAAPGGPRGDLAMFQLLGIRAPRLEKRVTELHDIAPEVSTVLALSPHLDSKEWALLRNWVGLGGHLVVSDHDRSFEDAFSIHVTLLDCDETPAADGITLSTLESPARAFSQVPTGEILSTCAGRASIVRLPVELGFVTLIADRTLFQNAGLANADNAQLVVAALGDPWGTVQVVGPWTGLGSKNPISSILAGSFGWWLLQLLLLALLYAYSEGYRFGAPRPLHLVSRRSFSEHALALAAHYRRRAASGWVLSRYAAWLKLNRSAPRGRAESRASSDNRLSLLLEEALAIDEGSCAEKEHAVLFRKLQGALLPIKSESLAPKEGKK